MDTNSLDHYKIWAPDNVEWTAWAKPVLFVGKTFPKASALNIKEIQVQPDFRTMIIVDLPGQQSVEEALAFAKRGYRPVPLYNGTLGLERMLVNVREVREAIFFGTDVLKSLPLMPDSPPVFMLDSRRMNGAKTPGTYDNRWCVFPQDMPSAVFLKSKGINRIIVRTGQDIKTDLERILYEYHRSGIALYVLRGNAKYPKELVVKKQSITKEWAYRFKVVIGLKRNATGGFGGEIPEPYSSGSGGRYYGIG
jgi:hypothetical protein